ncbi:MAG TPA: class III extradiol ring-cleavage dioxygenase [Bacteroidia bacterium]|jgi:4,5-DOPA dioxygenase extradiol|nr:class III extradiol ring-cleavage dioxygenase [Bacteroidia bacterium]
METGELKKITNGFSSTKKMPVLFTSHGNPMEALSDLNATPFFTSLGQVSKKIRDEFSINAVVVISAHWCTRGTFVNVGEVQETIHDYSGFPKQYYEIQYPVHGSPVYAHEVAKLSPAIHETKEWGLDHGSWPILRHYFPNGDVPVFQMSIDYYQSAQYHYDLAKQLKSLREKGVLIIGSGSIVHNLKAAVPKMFGGDMKLYGWEPEFDAWVKKKLEERDFEALVNYEKHPLGLTAAPTPDHYVPMLYSLGLADKDENIEHTFEELLPAFSNRGFRVG